MITQSTQSSEKEQYKSRYRGVYRCGKRWKAQLQSHGIQFYLGMFDSEEEAARAYDRKAREEKTGRSMMNFSSGASAAEGSEYGDGYTDNSSYMNPMALPPLYNGGLFNSKYGDGGPNSKRQRTDHAPFSGTTGTRATESSNEDKILARKLDYESTTENMRILWDRHCQIAQRLLLARATQAKLLELQSMAPDSEKEQLLTALSDELVLLAVVKAQLEEAVSRCLVMGLEFNTSQQGRAEEFSSGGSMPVSAAAETARSAKQWRDSYMASQLNRNSLGLAEKGLHPPSFPVDCSAAGLGVYPSASVTTSVPRSMYANAAPPVERAHTGATPSMRGYQGLSTTQHAHPWNSYFNYSTLGPTPYSGVPGSAATSLPGGMGMPKAYDLNMAMGGPGMSAMPPYGLLGHDMAMGGGPLGMHSQLGLDTASLLYPNTGLGFGGRHGGVDGLHSSHPGVAHSLPGLGESINAGLSHLSDCNTDRKVFPAPMPLASLTSTLPIASLPELNPSFNSPLEACTKTSFTSSNPTDQQQSSLAKPTNSVDVCSNVTALSQGKDNGEVTASDSAAVLSRLEEPVVPKIPSNITPSRDAAVSGADGGVVAAPATTTAAAAMQRPISTAVLESASAVFSELPLTAAPPKSSAQPNKQQIGHKVAAASAGGRPRSAGNLTAYGHQGSGSPLTIPTQVADLDADIKASGYKNTGMDAKEEVVTIVAGAAEIASSHNNKDSRHSSYSNSSRKRK